MCWSKCSLFFSSHSAIPSNVAWAWERKLRAIPLDPQMKFAGICTKSVGHPLKGRGRDWEHCIRGPRAGLHASLVFILLDFQLGNKKLPFQFGARTLFSPLRWLTHKILCWSKCSLFFSSHSGILSNLVLAWETNHRAIPLYPQMKFAGICWVIPRKGMGVTGTLPKRSSISHRENSQNLGSKGLSPSRG